jgi:sulfite exporter TauE/SafE
VLLGHVGSLGHSVGMCAPFVMFVGRRFGRGDGRVPVAAQSWYHAGRLVTYVALGAAAGAIGGAVELAGRLVGLQRAAALLAGAALVATALAALTRRLPGGVAGDGAFARIARLVPGRMPGHPFAAGLFLGLLPCGLLYSALVAAVSRGGALGGAIALACFGLGTVPALAGVSLADTMLTGRRAFVNTLSQTFLLTMGAWFLWRGLGR